MKDHTAAVKADLAAAMSAAMRYLARVKTPLPETYEYGAVRETYAGALTDAFLGYVGSGGPVTRWRNQAGRAVIEGTADAFYRGYDDAGGEETEDEDEQWLTQRQKEQVNFLPDVFDWIGEQRDAETITEDIIAERVDVWVASLDGTYTEGKLRGSKNKTLVFVGDDGMESCEVCQSLKGKRHKIRWILDNDAIPRPGNSFFTCQGYRCQHYWEDPKTGERYTF